MRSFLGRKHTEETKRKMSAHWTLERKREHSKIVKEAWKDGRIKAHHTSWCKGLTKENNEILRRSSEKQRGRTISSQSRAKISKANKGLKRSDEFKRKIGERSKERWNNEEFRKAHRLSMAKYVMTLSQDERKEKYGRRGDQNSSKRPEVREKIRQSKLGNKNPMKRAEVRHKVSETLKRKYLNGEIEDGLTKAWTENRERMLNIQRQNMNRKPNNLEMEFSLFLQNNNLPFKYVGDFSFWIGPCKSGKCRNPDFIHVNHLEKTAILLSGAYWHSQSEMLTELEDYKSRGWNPIWIWEEEFRKQPCLVLEMIKSEVG